MSATAAPVQSVAGRTGAIVLAVGDVSGAAPLASPALTGTPTAPTAAAGTTSTQVATTAFVSGAVAASTTGVSSFNGRTGAITLTATDVAIAAATVAPVADGTATVGTSTLYARQDHVHPTDTTRYAASNPSGYQTAAQVTAALPVAASVAPLVDGTATTGTSALFARQDHVHPTDTSRYAASNPSGYQTAAQVSSAVATATVRNVRTITTTGTIIVTASDYLIKVKKTTGSATAVSLEPLPVAGSQHVIKDGKGDCDINPITITPDGTGTIDGQPNFVLNVPTGAITMIYDGAEWALV